MQIRQFSDPISLRWTQIMSHGWFSQPLTYENFTCWTFPPLHEVQQNWSNERVFVVVSWTHGECSPHLPCLPTARHELHKRPSHWFWVLDILHSGLVTGQGKADWWDTGECLGCPRCFQKLKMLRLLQICFNWLSLRHSSMNHQIHTCFFLRGCFLCLRTGDEKKYVCAADVTANALVLQPPGCHWWPSGGG